jgi:hypothetical protein
MINYALFISAVLAVSVSAFAAEPSLLPKGPPTYEKLDENPDGSVTIIRPRLDFGNRKAIPIYYRNSDGVCKLYGYESHISATKEDVSGDEKPIIGNDGEVIGFGYSFTAYETLTCRPPAPELSQSKPKYENKLINFDGSVTIMHPRFDSNGKQFPLSFYDTNSLGVCKLFGYEKFISLSTVTKNYVYAFYVNAEGKVAGRQDIIAAYESISCR